MTMTEILRNCVAKSKVSLREIERETGVKYPALSRFVRKKQSLRLDLADKLAAYFGVKVVPPTKARKER